MGFETRIVDVTEFNFEESVLDSSLIVPVVVVCTDLLSASSFAQLRLYRDLQLELNGHFILAKIEISENGVLAERFLVSQAPTVMIFHQGDQIYFEEGLMNEKKARSALKVAGIINDGALEKKQPSRNQNVPAISALLLLQMVRRNPYDERMAIALVKDYLGRGELHQAQRLLEGLPSEVRSSEAAKVLKNQIVLLLLASETDGQDRLQKRLQALPGDMDTLFDLALCYAAERRFQESMEILFRLQQMSDDYKGGAPREMLATVLTMLSSVEPDLAEVYRDRFSDLTVG